MSYHWTCCSHFLSVWICICIGPFKMSVDHYHAVDDCALCMQNPLCECKHNLFLHVYIIFDWLKAVPRIRQLIGGDPFWSIWSLNLPNFCFAVICCRVIVRLVHICIVVDTVNVLQTIVYHNRTWILSICFTVLEQNCIPKAYSQLFLTP